MSRTEATRPVPAAATTRYRVGGASLSSTHFLCLVLVADSTVSCVSGAPLSRAEFFRTMFNTDSARVCASGTSLRRRSRRTQYFSTVLVADTPCHNIGSTTLSRALSRWPVCFAHTPCMCLCGTSMDRTWYTMKKTKSPFYSWRRAPLATTSVHATVHVAQSIFVYKCRAHCSGTQFSHWGG